MESTTCLTDIGVFIDKTIEKCLLEYDLDSKDPEDVLDDMEKTWPKTISCGSCEKQILKDCNGNNVPGRASDAIRFNTGLGRQRHVPVGTVRVKTKHAVRRAEHETHETSGGASRPLQAKRAKLDEEASGVRWSPVPEGEGEERLATKDSPSTRGGLNKTSCSSPKTTSLKTLHSKLKSRLQQRYLEDRSNPSQHGRADRACYIADETADVPPPILPIEIKINNNNNSNNNNNNSNNSNNGADRLSDYAMQSLPLKEDGRRELRRECAHTSPTRLDHVVRGGGPSPTLANSPKLLTRPVDAPARTVDTVSKGNGLSCQKPHHSGEIALLMHPVKELEGVVHKVSGDRDDCDLDERKRQIIAFYRNGYDTAIQQSAINLKRDRCESCHVANTVLSRQVGKEICKLTPTDDMKQQHKHEQQNSKQQQQQLEQQPHRPLQHHHQHQHEHRDHCQQQQQAQQHYHPHKYQHQQQQQHHEQQNQQKQQLQLEIDNNRQHHCGILRHRHEHCNADIGTPHTVSESSRISQIILKELQTQDPIPVRRHALTQNIPAFHQSLSQEPKPSSACIQRRSSTQASGSDVVVRHDTSKKVYGPDRCVSQSTPRPAPKGHSPIRRYYSVGAVSQRELVGARSESVRVNVPIFLPSHSSHASHRPLVHTTHSGNDVALPSHIQLHCEFGTQHSFSIAADDVPHPHAQAHAHLDDDQPQDLSIRPRKRNLEQDAPSEQDFIVKPYVSGCSSVFPEGNRDCHGCLSTPPSPSACVTTPTPPTSRLATPTSPTAWLATPTRHDMTLTPLSQISVSPTCCADCECECGASRYDPIPGVLKTLGRWETRGDVHALDLVKPSVINNKSSMESRPLKALTRCAITR